MQEMTTKEIEIDITKASSFLTKASKSLSISYTLPCKDKDLIIIRAKVYSKAILYKNKIAPLSDTTIRQIDAVCNNIHVSDVNEFKKNLFDLITDTQSSVQLCEYANIFHLEILTEFKRIQNDFILMILKLELSEDFEEKIAEAMAADDFKLADIMQIIPSSLDKTNDDKQLAKLVSTSKKVEKILGPLMNSISDYNCFFKQMAGCFNNLYNKLLNLEVSVKQTNKEDVNIPFKFKEITFIANMISGFCNKYLNSKPDYESELDSIPEEIPDDSCTNKWILDAINKHKEKVTLSNFKNLLTKKDVKLIKIYGLQNNP